MLGGEHALLKRLNIVIGGDRNLDLPKHFAGIDAVRRVGEHAESKDHHPDIDIRWRTVTFALVTHSEGGITKNDIDMARDINGIVDN